ncbi:uncharacterized protein LOC117169127 isoform X2 [Belonocnema kinseyi]|nr:uncharacterized protein LOC117169127 isoform X2 [Belonocnema kinseyi]
MNRQDVVTLLLQNGADQNIISDHGESPKTVSTNPQILQQLMTSSGGLTKISNHKAYNALHQGPFLDYNVDQIHSKVTSASEGSANYSPDQLVLKVRLANAPDPDFIEIDLPKAALTYQVLLQVCCQELELDESRVIKLRKLPNTKIRRDKDVERLENFQEIEIVTESPSDVHSQSSNGAALPLTATNNYLSISKKDQTILY